MARSSAPDVARSLERSLELIERLEGELSHVSEPIAVIGLGCRFPRADDAEEYWQLLCRGEDVISGVPASRWDADAYFDDDPATPGTSSSRAGGFLDDVDLFDPQFFGISPKEADHIDPQQRLLLEVAWQTLEHAGIPAAGLRGSSTGVFVGITENDYGRIVEQVVGPALTHHDATGTGYCFASGRISHVLGLTGPNVAIDTACSSSLVAIHHAVSALRAGECDLALAGGVHLRLAVTTTLALARTGALSPDGRCKAFAAGADGYGRSEGCGLVALRRLGDVDPSRERVLAVIRGTATNHDGPASGFTVPSAPAQAALITDALARARTAATDVGYVEAHGTGTALGDPIEVEALGDVFSARATPLIVGSVKSNIGHLEGAAGIASFIKAVLAVERGVVPANLHFDEPNPLIRWDRLPFVVPTVATPWGQDGPRVAGVSSFGMSGTNAHVIVASPPDGPRVASPVASGSPPASDGRSPRPFVLPVSARTETALVSLAQAFASRIASSDDGDAADVCASAALGRSPLRERLVVVAASPSELAAHLDAWADAGAAPVIRGSAAAATRLAFMFTGQGSQWPGMGAALYRSEPVFAGSLHRCADLVSSRSDLDLLRLVVDDDSSQALALLATSAAQPAIFAYEWALSELLRSWGVEPSVVVGHSIGYYVAAVVAGVLTLDDALTLVVERGRLMEVAARGGAMTATRSTREEMSGRLDRSPSLSIAAVNAERDVVVSGDLAAIVDLEGKLERDGVAYRRLPVSHAFHSPLLDPVVGPYRDVVATVPLARPSRTLVSDLTGDVAGAEVMEAGHWARHLREPVQFGRALDTLAALGVESVVEVGPSRVLATIGARAYPALHWHAAGDQADPLAAYSALARLWSNGTPVDWAAIDAPRRGRPVAIPHVPFDRSRHWIDGPTSSSVAAAGPTDGLRRRRSLLDPVLHSATLRATVGRTTVAIDDPLVADHVVDGAPLVAAAHQLALVVAAARAAGPGRPVVLRGIAFGAAIAPAPTSEVEVVVRDDGGFTIATVGLAVTTGTVVRPDGQPDLGPPALAGVVDSSGDHTDDDMDDDDLRKRLAASGFEMGPSYSWIAGVRRSGDGLVASIDGRGRSTVLGDWLHPGVVDAGLQLTIMLLGDGASPGVPFEIDELAVAATAAEVTQVVVQRRGGGWDIDLCDVRGDVVTAVRGYRERPLGDVHPAGTWSRWIGRLQWSPTERPGSHRPPRSVELAGDLAAGEALGHLPSVPVGDRDGVDPVMLLVLPAGGNDPGADDATDAVEATRALVHQLLDGADGRRLVVVTRSGQRVHAGDRVVPAHAAVAAFCRSVRVEFPEVDCRVLDVDVLDHRLLSWIDAVDRPLVALRRGVAYVPDPVGGRRVAASPRRVVRRSHDGPRSLTVGPMALRPPSSNEAQIDVRASGVNFRDVLVSAGVVTDHVHETPGHELAGRVVSVGSAVEGIEPGDDVVALADEAFATLANVESDRLVRLAPSGSFAAAATLPMAFLTAAHAIEVVADVRAGDRVLVHAAAGGVGQAALQLCLRRGAIVYATAHPTKHDLVRRLGASAVWSSRDGDFGPALVAVTEGRGVDMVLNLLGDDLVAPTLDALTVGGRFVELGRLRQWDTDAVAAARPDVAYTRFDIGDVVAADPDSARRSLQEVVAAAADGTLGALPVTGFDLAEAGDALELVQAGRHTGKVVLTSPASDGFRRDASYLITGGLGGLGVLIARRLAERGAGHLVLASRSAVPDERVDALVASIEAMGCTVVLIAADVTDEAEVRRLVETCEALAPLRGIVHAAGVLDDSIVVNLDADRCAAVLAPKTRGAWLLHEATRSLRLDHFVMFSSVAAVSDAGGQAAYAAANAFLDGLAHRRRAEGLPALSIAWGPWSEVGMAARGAGAIRADGGWMAPSGAIAAFDSVLASIDAHVVVAPGWVTAAAAPPAPEPASTAPVSLASPEDLRRHLDRRVRAVLGLRPDDPLDRRTPLAELGVDSLMAVELRNILQLDLGEPLTAAMVFDHPTIDALAAHLGAIIDVPDATAPLDGPAVPVDELRLLLDDELRALAGDEAGER